MEYKKPKMEILCLNLEDIVRTSLTDGGSGDHEGVGGDGTQPWE